MLRTEFLLILPLVVAVTVGQADRGYSYYGTSNVRDQRPQPIYGQRPLILPGRPMPVTGPVTAAPEAPAAPAPVVAAPSYAPVLRPRPQYTSVYRPLLPPRPIRPPPSSTAPSQPSATGEPQPQVTEAAPSLQPVEANTPEPPILPEHAVEQPEPAPTSIITAQPGEPVAVEPLPEAVPTGEPAPVSEQSPVPEPIQPSAVVSKPVPHPESISQPEPIRQLEPIQQPGPEPQSEPIQQTEPEPQAEPIQQPGPGPQPKPIPQADPILQPEPVLQPEPIPQLKPISQPEPVQQPEPVSQPEPALRPEPIPEPEPVQQPEPALQPEDIPQPDPTQEIVQAQEPAVFPERDAVPFPEPSPKPVSAPQPTSLARSINVPQSPTPVALPPLLPKPQAVREPAFGRHVQPSVPPMIYYPTVTYPTRTPSYPPTPTQTVATQAPPVVVTTQSHPPVTQASGQLKFDFQCKEGNGYYSVEHECDTYIECKQNRAMKYACPDGLHFNPAAKHYEYPCAYPSEVKCMAGDQEQSPMPTAKCPNQYGFYSMNDGDCSKFIMCQEGLATIMNCPMGLAFNPQTSSCDWPANVPQCNPNVFKDFTCPDPPEDEDGQVSDIIYKYRYEEQCKLYVACQLGHPRLLSCERGLSFDDASQACIDEDYVTDCSVPNVEQLQ